MKQNIKSLGVGEFKDILQKQKPIIIDIRTPGELLQTGIIAGAKNMDIYSRDILEKLSALDKNKKYLIYCRSGSRTNALLGAMKDMGFTDVGELAGGIISWLQAGETLTPFNT